MTTSILHVYANRSNVGDWLSAIGIRSLLSEAGGGAPVPPLVEALCDEPFIPDLARALAERRDGDVVIVGGGGLVMDYFTPLWEVLAAHVGRLQVVLWGIGVVDLKQEPSLPDLALVRRVAAQATLSAVRDVRTAERLGGDTSVVPCPALVAVEASEVQERGLCHSANLTTVGEHVYEAMVDVLTGYAASTGRTYRETNNRIAGDRTDQMEEVLSRYRRSDLIASSRLHGCIIAIAMGRPVVAVSGDHKVEGFMSQAGLGEWVLGQDDVAELPDRLDALGGQPHPTRFLADAHAAGRAVAERVLRLAER